MCAKVNKHCKHMVPPTVHAEPRHGKSEQYVLLRTWQLGTNETQLAEPCIIPKIN